MKKRTIKIAHLYYDLMNLYGESGNIKVLINLIEKQGVDAEVHFLTLEDDIDFQKFDLYYIGAGSEANEKIVLDDIIKYKDKIKSAIENEKFFVITGNAVNLFSKEEILLSGKTIPALGIFDYSVSELEKRNVGEYHYKIKKLDIDNKGKDLIAFKNTSFELKNNKLNFTNSEDTIKYKNFYALNIIGPVLVRNPYLTKNVLNTLFKSKGYEYEENNNTLDFMAYHEFLKNFINIEGKN